MRTRRVRPGVSYGLLHTRQPSRLPTPRRTWPDGCEAPRLPHCPMLDPFTHCMQTQDQTRPLPTTMGNALRTAPPVNRSGSSRAPLRAALWGASWYWGAQAPPRRADAHWCPPFSRQYSNRLQTILYYRNIAWSIIVTGMSDNPIRRSPRCWQPHGTLDKPRRGSSPGLRPPRRKKSAAREGLPPPSSTSVSLLICWLGWTVISTSLRSRRGARRIAA